jgi:rubrerythrin
MNHLEQIFDKCAKDVMVKWDLNNFKHTHPSLFRVIMESLQQVKDMPSNNTNDHICKGCGATKIEIQGGNFVCPYCED